MFLPLIRWEALKKEILRIGILLVHRELIFSPLLRDAF